MTTLWNCFICGGDFPAGHSHSQGCTHSWLDRPESDTHECLICGVEGSGPAPVAQCDCVVGICSEDGECCEAHDCRAMNVPPGGGDD